MKILKTRTFPAKVLGIECDRCRRRVQMTDSENGDRSAVSAGAELARFIAVDIAYNHAITRVDLCPPCASEFLESVRALLRFMRPIAETDAVSGRRSYEYRAIDSESGNSFHVSSLVDDGA